MVQYVSQLYISHRCSPFVCQLLLGLAPRGDRLLFFGAKAEALAVLAPTTMAAPEEDETVSLLGFVTETVSPLFDSENEMGAEMRAAVKPYVWCESTGASPPLPPLPALLPVALRCFLSPILSNRARALRITRRPIFRRSTAMFASAIYLFRYKTYLFEVPGPEAAAGM